MARYRLTPVSTATLVAGTVAARYLLLVAAGCCSSLLAMGARHAAAAPSVRALRGVHVRRVCLHRPRPRDRDDGRQRAGGAGARAVHFPADADHRRRRRAARDAAGLGAALVSSFFPGRYAVEALQACVTGRVSALARSASLRSSSSAPPAASPARRCSAGTRAALRRTAGQGLGGVALAAWVAVGCRQSRAADGRGRRGHRWHRTRSRAGGTPLAESGRHRASPPSAEPGACASRSPAVRRACVRADRWSAVRAPAAAGDARAQGELFPCSPPCPNHRRRHRPGAGPLEGRARPRRGRR